MNPTTATPNRIYPSSDELRVEIARLRNRNLRLEDTANRLQAEIGAAAAIQRDLLPRALPSVEGANINAYYRPVGEVSGDLYDVIRLDDRTTAIVVMDVSGHGVGAGMLATLLRQKLAEAIELCRSSGDLDPGRALALLNQAVIDLDLSDCQFVAATLAFFDEVSRVVRVARGGAPYPIVVRERATRATPLMSDGPIIGVLEDAVFGSVEIELEPGDAIILCTDGLERLLDEKAFCGLCSDSYRVARTDGRSSAGYQQLFQAVTEQINTAARAADADAGDDSGALDDTTLVVLDIAEPRGRIPSWSEPAEALPVPCLVG